MADTLTEERNEIEVIHLDRQHPTVARLMEFQDALKKSNNVFAKRWLPCSGSSWGRVKTGKYHAGDGGVKLLERLKSALSQLEQSERGALKSGSNSILPLSLVCNGLAGIEHVYHKERNRLVMVLAPSGGGKTTLARAIEEKYYGKVLSTEATETWRKSYLAALHKMLEAAGETEFPGSAAKAESALIRLLVKKARCIVIDEAHYFGPVTINLVKAILNQTSCTVVLLAIPDLWKRMKKSAWVESEQLRTRTGAMVTMEAVDFNDVELLLSARLNGAWSGLERPLQRKVIDQVTKASELGHLNTVSSIVEEIEEGIIDGRETFDAAIGNVMLLQG